MNTKIILFGLSIIFAITSCKGEKYVYTSYVTPENKYKLLKFDKDATPQLQTLSSTANSDQYVNANSDGSKLVIHRQPNIYMLNSDGTGEVQLTDLPAGDSGGRPKFDPTSGMIVYQESSVTRNTTNLFVLKTDGFRTPLTHPEEGETDVGGFDFAANNYVVFSRKNSNGDFDLLKKRYLPFSDLHLPGANITNTPNIKEKLPAVDNSGTQLAYVAQEGSDITIKVVSFPDITDVKHTIAIPPEVDKSSIVLLEFATNKILYCVASPAIQGPKVVYKIILESAQGQYIFVKEPTSAGTTTSISTLVPY